MFIARDEAVELAEKYVLDKYNDDSKAIYSQVDVGYDTGCGGIDCTPTGFVMVPFDEYDVLCNINDGTCEDNRNINKAYDDIISQFNDISNNYVFFRYFDDDYYFPSEYAYDGNLDNLKNKGKFIFGAAILFEVNDNDKNYQQKIDTFANNIISLFDYDYISLWVYSSNQKEMKQIADNLKSNNGDISFCKNECIDILRLPKYSLATVKK
jgi:hypothetical protein